MEGCKRAARRSVPGGPRSTTMKNIRILILIAGLSFACEHFADYRYEVSNPTSAVLRVEIGFYSGKDTVHIDSVRAYSTKEVFTTGTPITLGCNEDSPQNRGFDNIGRFIITVADSPSIRKDFKGSGLWTYRVSDRIGIYSISVNDSSFSK